MQIISLNKNNKYESLRYYLLSLLDSFNILSKDRDLKAINISKWDKSIIQKVVETLLLFKLFTDHKILFE